MKLVEWTDDNGYRHLSWIKDNDPEMEASFGLPADPPNLDQLDWDAIKRDLHNALIDRRLTDWKAVQKQQNGITSTILLIFKRRIIDLYRQEVKHDGN